MVYKTSDFGSSTQGERHNSYYANPIDKRRNPWYLRSHSVEIRKTQLHLQRSKFNSPLHGREPNSQPPWSNVNFKLTLFQNHQILRTISSGHDVIYSPAPFSVWGFNMAMVIVISFVRERKTSPIDYTPELLMRIVQSPTKLKEKI